MAAKTIDEILHPKIEPFKTGMLEVSKLHTIYWEISGNPKGKPDLSLSCMAVLEEPVKLNIADISIRNPFKSSKWISADVENPLHMLNWKTIILKH